MQSFSTVNLLFYNNADILRPLCPASICASANKLAQRISFGKYLLIRTARVVRRRIVESPYLPVDISQHLAAIGSAFDGAQDVSVRVLQCFCRHTLFLASDALSFVEFNARDNLHAYTVTTILPICWFDSR